MSLLELVTGVRGRLVAWGAAALGAVALIASIYRAGQNSQKVAEQRRELDSITEAKGIENEVAGLSSGDLRERAARWVH